MEKEVRALEQDGLIWGASKRVPVGYGVSMIQFTIVIEDDKVSRSACEGEAGADAFAFIRYPWKNCKKRLLRLKTMSNLAMSLLCKSSSRHHFPFNYACRRQDEFD